MGSISLELKFNFSCEKKIFCKIKIKIKIVLKHLKKTYKNMKVNSKIILYRFSRSIFIWTAHSIASITRSCAICSRQIKYKLQTVCDSCCTVHQQRARSQLLLFWRQTQRFHALRSNLWQMRREPHWRDGTFFSSFLIRFETICTKQHTFDTSRALLHIPLKIVVWIEAVWFQWSESKV